jgi:hypothetical protein
VVLSGCSKQPQDTATSSSVAASSHLPLLHFFTPEQFTLLALVADTILPRTDSPSATDVDAHTTVDSMVGQVFDANAKANFKSRWSTLQKHLEQMQFSQLNAEQQLAALQTLELNQDAAFGDARQGFIEVKQHLIAYYLSSEEIGEKFLNYLPIPGNYQPCISINDVNNKAWAL